VETLAEPLPCYLQAFGVRGSSIPLSTPARSAALATSASVGAQCAGLENVARRARRLQQHAEGDAKAAAPSTASIDPCIWASFAKNSAVRAYLGRGRGVSAPVFIELSRFSGLVYHLPAPHRAGAMPEEISGPKSRAPRRVSIASPPWRDINRMRLPGPQPWMWLILMMVRAARATGRGCRDRNSGTLRLLPIRSVPLRNGDVANRCG